MSKVSMDHIANEWEQIFNALPDLIAILDMNHRIARVNSAMAERLGMSAEDCIGQSCHRIVHGSDTIPDICPHARLLKDKSMHAAEVHDDHLKGDFIVTTTPLFDQNGALAGCVHVMRDVTARTLAENTLKENEKRLRLITNNMLDLITVVGMDMNVEYISPSHKQVLGYEPQDLVKRWSFDFIHPDDRGKVVQFIRDIAANGRHDTVEFRFHHADGHYLWLESVGSMILDERGEKVGIVFASRDITERMRSSQALRDSEARYREILDSIDDGYYEVDLSGHFTFFNDVLPHFLGYPREELMGGYFKTAMDDENVKKVFGVFHQVFLTGVPSRLVEFECKRKDGSRASVESSVFLIRDVEGNPVGFRGVVRDITERKQFQDRLQTMAVTDQLTGLFNRRGFITHAEQQLKIADRTGKKVLLAFIDLDGMKHINDVWGHEEGDRALIATATILRETFRDSDIVARIGGDEFAVLAPDVADTIQDVFASRLQQQTNVHNIENGRAYTLTMSVGSTFYDPNDPCSLDELMSRADRLMYEDKRRKAV